MEELLELRELVRNGRYDEALALIAEMEEMSRDDKITKIVSFAEILLLHLIKRVLEHWTTRSWDLSIWNAANHIMRINRRRKTGGVYVQDDDLKDAVSEAFQPALRRAALEVLDGRYTVRELSQLCRREEIVQEALNYLQSFQAESEPSELI
jgi:hypothetical protein